MGGQQLWWMVAGRGAVMRMMLDDAQEGPAQKPFVAHKVRSSSPSSPSSPRQALAAQGSSPRTTLASTVSQGLLPAKLLPSPHGESFLERCRGCNQQLAQYSEALAGTFMVADPIAWVQQEQPLPPWLVHQAPVPRRQPPPAVVTHTGAPLGGSDQ